MERQSLVVACERFGTISTTAVLCSSICQVKRVDNLSPAEEELEAGI